MPTATRTNPLSYLSEQLSELKNKGTYFRLRVLEDEQAPECTFDGKRVINLASNNYLGLTTHPKLREAALEATRKFGVGSGAVRAHRQGRIPAWTPADAAVVRRLPLPVAPPLSARSHAQPSRHGFLSVRDRARQGETGASRPPPDRLRHVFRPGFDVTPLA